MKITFMPKARLGKYSAILVVIAIAMVIIINVIDNYFGLPGGVYPPFYIDRILFQLLAFIVLVSVVFSIISGLKATIKCKERSILVFICILIDVLAIYFAIAEFIGFITGSPD